ncbi:MAG: NAD-dependent epimerase/dehydratase [Firmicutes bacterium]|nr:NAD-dependent epimerase/dehydratase [Bacillota bacterium]
MANILITGGAGFFGSILKRRLLDLGYNCISIDLEEDTDIHPNLVSFRGDIRDLVLLETLFSKYKFDAIFHCAAILAHAIKDKRFLWTSNVDGTRNIAEFAKKYNVQRIIFTSSNCLWGRDMKRMVLEDEAPCPIEIYGKSKWEAEKILLQYKEYMNVIIFRCPTIMDSGRLGLLSILFQFINEGRKVWVVGDGNNFYQFIYAEDLVHACIAALEYNSTDIFNIGSDNVKSFKDVYNYVIEKSNTGARVAFLPKRITLWGMKLAYMLKLSPLGPYQYNMIAGSFIFDTTKIKAALNWQPTFTNEEMLYKAYEYYKENKSEIENRKGVSAHKQSAKMGIIRVLKWLS